MKTRDCFVAPIVSCLLAITALFVLAQARAEPVAEKRTVLAIIDTSEEINRSQSYNLIHNNAEMPLNYLGLRVRYHDISKGEFPSEESLSDVLGIVTWFTDDSVPGAVEYCRWLAARIRKGTKYVMFGNIGAFKDSITKKVTPLGAVNDVFNAMGLEYIGDWTNNPLLIELVRKDPEMVEFERTLEDELGIYESIAALDEESKVYLKLKRTDIPGSESDAVVITPKGAFALESYAMFLDYVTEKARWRINPFLFFQEAFGLEEKPRSDTTTLFGRRIFYSHIDGDGVRNISRIDNKTFSGAVIKGEILEKYDLPITASFITADIDPKYFGSEKLINLAREILNLPNIEAGQHGFSHPLDWERQLTVFPIRGYSKPAHGGKELELVSESHYGDASVITVGRQEYLDTEIVKSTKYTDEHLAPPGNKVALYQWTGDCRPPAAAIRLTKEIGLENINGGDTRFDRSIPSYTGVAPLTRQKGGEVQVYTSNANENIYTNEWTGPFDGFVKVIETFKQTEIPTLVKSGPRRVSPMNVYYHFYSGERKKSLGALKTVYDYVLTQDTIPLRASHYSAIVNGFVSMKVNVLGDGGWEFTDYGRCRTIRFDGTRAYPDLNLSKGVLGFKTWHNYLYIHLGAENRAVVYLTDKKPDLPCLEESSTVLRSFEISKDEISFDAQGWGKAVYKFHNMRPGTRYAVKVYGSKEDPVHFKKFTSDGEGGLELHLPMRGEFKVMVERGS